MEKGLIVWIGIIIVLAVITVLLGINYNPTGRVIQQEKPVVKIGATLPLTGGVGFIGQGAQRSILLAKEKFKDTKFNYEVIFEDDKLDVKEASTTTTKLINIDKVNVIISMSSGIGNVVSPITQKNKVLHINPFASDPNVAKGEYNFIHWTTPEEEVKVMVEELQIRGIKEIAILELNQQGILAIVENLKNELEGTGIKIVAREKFNFGDKDFKTILLKTKEKNPDIYFLLAASPELEIIAKQGKELGINKFTSVESFEFTDQPELFEGLWYIQAADPTGNFVNLYKRKYKDNPPVAAANSYDAFNLIVEAYERAGKKTDGKPTAEQAAEELLRIRGYSGAVGPLTMKEGGIIDSKPVVRQVKNGKFVTIRNPAEEEVVGLN